MRTLLALLLSGLILGGVVFAWAAGEEEIASQAADPAGPMRPGEPPVLELGPKPAGGDETDPSEVALHLQRKTKLIAKGHSLQQVVDHIAEATDSNFWIDAQALSEIGVETDAAIELDIEGISLEAVLRNVLRQVDRNLTLYEVNDIIFITIRKDDNELKRYLFDVAALLPADQPPVVRHVYRGATFTPQPEPVQEVTDLIESMVFPDYWSGVGGPGTIDFVGHTIIVHAIAHHPIREHIEALLSNLHKAKAWDGRDQQVLREFAAPEETHWQLLEREVTLQFKEQPLQEVAAFIAKIIDVPVQIDQAALREIGLDDNLPVTIHLRDVNLRIGLELIFLSIDPDLSMTFEDEVLLITIREFAQQNVYTRIYPVRDLANSEARLVGFVDVLKANVPGDTWDEVGGPGNLAYFGPSRALVVSQSAEVHREVDAFLADLRKHRARKSAQRPAVDAHPAPQPEDDAVNDDELKLDEAWPVVVYHIELPEPLPSSEEGDQKRAMMDEPSSLRTLPKLVKRLTGKQHWRGEHATIELLGEHLVIRQTPAVHNHIEGLLRRLNVLESSGRPIGISTGPRPGF